MALFDRKHNQQVARIVRDKHGIEMTPDEVDGDRRSAFSAIRAQLRAHGYRIPDSDAELLILMQRVLKED